jgi:hypothetical protein
MIRKLPAVFAALFLLTGCTVITTPEFKIIDFHPSGDAIDVSVKKADGTVIEAVREQGSNAEIIGAAVDAAVGL